MEDHASWTWRKTTVMFTFAAVLFTLPCINFAAGESLKYIVMGDWGGLPFFPYRTPIEEAVAREMGKIADKLDARFVLALGDNFYFDGVKDVDDPRFQETYNRVFRSFALHRNWYLIAGNHDHYGNVSAQIAYTNRMKQWNFPDYYYALNFTLPGSSVQVDIVMIDTILLCGNTLPDQLGGQPHKPESPQVASDQLTWIEEQLKKSRAEYLIVAGHFPVYSVAEHGTTTCLVDKVEPLLHKYGVTAYFSGHDHNLQHLEFNNMTTVNYFVSGAANFVDPSLAHMKTVPPGSLKFHWANIFSLGGFAFVETTPNNMTFTFIEANAKVLYSKVLYPRKVPSPWR